MEIDKWHSLINDAVDKLSDESYQRLMWISGDRIEEMSTWDEFLCVLFDDYNFDAFIDDGYWRDAGVSPEEHYLLMNLRDSINYASKRLGEHPDPEYVLRSSEWMKVMCSAQRIVDLKRK